MHTDDIDIKTVDTNQPMALQNYDYEDDDEDEEVISKVKREVSNSYWCFHIKKHIYPYIYTARYIKSDLIISLMGLSYGHYDYERSCKVIFY